MKKTTTLSILGMILSAASLQAQTIDIYLSGSTAFRNNAERAITNLYAGNLLNQNPGGVGGAIGASKITFGGTIPALFGATPVNIHCGFNGSLTGIDTLAKNITVSFFASPTNGDATSISVVPDLGFSDVFAGTVGDGFANLIDNYVAVQPFCLVKDAVASTSFTNVTHQQLQDLLPNGVEILSYFTGDTNDDSVSVHLVGRDQESGTRWTASRDSGVAAQDVAGEQLYFLNVAAPLVNGLYQWTNGFTGFTSGGNITTFLNNPAGGGRDSKTGPTLSYVGLADVFSAVLLTNVVTYDGHLPWGNFITNASASSFTNDFSPIIKGNYSLWSIEHLFELPKPSSVTPKWQNADTLATNLVSLIDSDINTIAPKNAIRLSEMKVTRKDDGGVITPGNF